MEAREIIERYDAMHLDDSLLRKCFVMLAESSQKSALSYLDCIEGMHTYNNYVTEPEANDIVSSFVNCDGSSGAKWSVNQIVDFVQSVGAEYDREPYYNKFALYVAMNMMHSDHCKVLSKWSEGDSIRYAEMCYDLAISQLTDRDRQHWIREYFHL